MKKKLLNLLIFFLLSTLIVHTFFLPKNVKAVEAEKSSIEIMLFYGEGCPHCEAAETFLEKITLKYEDVIFNTYEVYYNKENQIKMLLQAKKLNTQVRGVPFIVVGDQYFTGYGSDASSGKKIQQAIEDQLGQNTVEKESLSEKKHAIDLPIIGTINPADVSLPVLTILVAAIDGFNPCAMWTLLFLISLLIGIEDKKRRWTLGILFILTSGFVYFLFLAAWFNLFAFFGFVTWIKLIIGILALVSGTFYLKEVFMNKDNACKVTSNKNRLKILNGLKALTQKKQLLIAAAGIIALAFAVNLIELVCSAGLPAIYTQVLSMSSVPTWKYYSYLLLYVFIFMLDDLFVFFTAMVTLKAIGLENKFARFSHLIGGILLVVIGILLIFKPELLMFG